MGPKLNKADIVLHWPAKDWPRLIPSMSTSNTTDTIDLVFMSHVGAEPQGIPAPRLFTNVEFLGADRV